VLEEVLEQLEARPIPLNIPIGSGSIKDSPTPFTAIIDLIEMKAIYFDGDDGKKLRREPIPDALRAESQGYREKLFDALTAHDDEDRLTSAYLEGKEIPVETIRQLVRELTLRQVIQPVLCGSGREHIGIQPLLDAI